MGRKVHPSNAYMIKLMKDNVTDLHHRLDRPASKLTRENARILSLLYTTRLMLSINLTEALVLKRKEKENQ